MTKAVLIKTCPACETAYRKAWRHQTYCSLECAIYPRIDKRGPDECWPWTGGGNDRGYGQVSWNKERVYVHRFVCFGNAYSDSALHTLHSCDNPPCCNGAHLKPGTRDDNMADKAARGRVKTRDIRGASNPRIRFNEAQVRQIREALKGGQTARQIAKLYGSSVGAIEGIQRGTTWAYLV